MPDNLKNYLHVEGENNNVSGITQIEKQEIKNIYPSPPEPPPQIITNSSAWTLNKKDFLPRDDEVNKVMEIIRDDPQIKLQIRGIGGLGKTSLSCQLFWEYHESKADGIEHLGWINYNGDLKSSIFQNIESNTVTADKPDEYLQQARSFFNALGKKLLLFVDNADDITDEDINFLTTCACRVVLTARYKIEGVDEYSLPPFSPEVCVELYRKISNDRSPADEAAIREIVERAGNHTQTIHLLAKTQKVCGYTAQKLLDELKERGFTLAGISAEISSGRLDKKVEAEFFEHMKMLFDIAKITDENQLRALKLFSLLAPNVPLERLTANEWFSINNITKLIKRGWLNDDENNGVYIHPVIAQVVRYSAPTDLQTSEELIVHLKNALKNSQGKGFNIQNKLIAHAVSVAECFSDEEDTLLSVLYNWIGGIYQELGEYDKALDYHEKDKAIHEKVLGTEHPSTATIYNNIASVYDYMGDYDKALEYNEKALAILEKVFGPEHPDTATTYNNIALLYNNMGNYDKALEYNEKALAIFEKVIGTEHPHTATIYNNIALLYNNMGNYDKALKYFKKALAIVEKVLGTEHPDTARTYISMASLYQTTGNYKKALEYNEKALAIQEKVLGTEHPDTAATYNNIAGVYYAKGVYDKALEYNEKALAIQEKVLGTEHPYTAATYNNIAAVYIANGDYDKALDYAHKARKIFEKVLGEEHPNTKNIYYLLAGIYAKKDEFENGLEYAIKAGIMEGE